MEEAGGVAQLAEQGIHKPWVSGSNPLAAIVGATDGGLDTCECVSPNSALFT